MQVRLDAIRFTIRAYCSSICLTHFPLLSYPGGTETLSLAFSSRAAGISLSCVSDSVLSRVPRLSVRTLSRSLKHHALARSI